MGRTLIDAEFRARNSTLENGSITPASESDPDAWFYDASRVLLGNDAGLQLHYLTGYPQSSCYAYVAKNAAKRRPPPEHLLRKLFHSDAGEPWHNAFMHGCKAQWWLDVQDALKIKRALDNR